MPEKETHFLETKKKQSYQIGQIVENPYRPPKGKIPKNTRWVLVEKNPDKGYPLVWRLESIHPETPTFEQLPSIKPPELIREEIKEAQIEDWHRRTDNN